MTYNVRIHTELISSMIISLVVTILQVVYTFVFMKYVALMLVAGYPSDVHLMGRSLISA